MQEENNKQDIQDNSFNSEPGSQKQNDESSDRVLGQEGQDHAWLNQPLGQNAPNTGVNPLQNQFSQQQSPVQQPPLPGQPAANAFGSSQTSSSQGADRWQNVVTMPKTAPNAAHPQSSVSQPSNLPPKTVSPGMKNQQGGKKQQQPQSKVPIIAGIVLVVCFITFAAVKNYIENNKEKPQEIEGSMGNTAAMQAMAKDFKPVEEKDLLNKIVADTPGGRNVTRGEVERIPQANFYRETPDAVLVVNALIDKYKNIPVAANFAKDMMKNVNFRNTWNAFQAGDVGEESLMVQLQSKHTVTLLSKYMQNRQFANIVNEVANTPGIGEQMEAIVKNPAAKTQQSDLMEGADTYYTDDRHMDLRAVHIDGTSAETLTIPKYEYERVETVSNVVP